MKGLDINFRELFVKKHGNKVFQDIVNQIKEEYNYKCDTSYIDIVFTVAFISHLGITDTSKIRLLGNISKKFDIVHIQTIHKKAISLIQNYIENTNTKIQY